MVGPRACASAAKDHAMPNELLSASFGALTEIAEESADKRTDKNKRD